MESIVISIIIYSRHSQYRTNIQGELTVFLESETASGDECEHRQHARTHPMTDTNISMVAKTVGPGASPPSTIAGSTGGTVPIGQ